MYTLLTEVPNSAYKNIKGSTKIGLIILFILMGLIIRLIFFTGISGADDLFHIFPAFQMSKGIFLPYEHFEQLRLGITLPAALSFNIFGFNQFTISLYPLICSLMSIILVYFLGRTLIDEKTGLLAALLLTFYPLDVIFSTKLYVDVPLAFFMGLVIYFYLRAFETDKKRFYVLCGLSLGISYICKLNGLYILLVMGLYTIYKRRFDLKSLFIILGFLAIFVPESIYYHKKTGDLLYRFKIASGSGVTEIQSMYDQATEPHGKVDNGPNLDPTPFFKKEDKGAGIVRGSNWYFEPLLMLLTNQEFGFFCFFIIPISGYCLVKRKRKVYVILLWMIPLFLYLAYGSISPFRYVPLRRWPRYYTPITFPALILLSYFLIEKKTWLREKFLPFSVLFLLLTSIGFIYLDNGRDRSYLVKKLADFKRKHPETNLIVSRETYYNLAPFLAFDNDPRIRLYNISKADMKQLDDEKSVYHNLSVANFKEINEGFVVINSGDSLKPSDNWKLYEQIIRPERRICNIIRPLEAYFPKNLWHKISNKEICSIYSVS